MARFLDANIFLRHLRNDDPVRSPACKALFDQIEQGTLEAWTSDLVVSEVVFVLSNKRTYNTPRPDIARELLRLIRLPNLKIANRRIYRRVFELYTSLSMSYVDCYNAALMEHRKQTEAYTYDTDFDAVPSIMRIEP
jgi:predicted nucleic acid-binding protein